MINLILIIIFILLLISGLLLLLLIKQRAKFGTLLGNRIYQDTEKLPGKILYSGSLPLLGKPDYLLQKGKTIIPVEVKTGKTPPEPYKNHVMQLIAYCHLVEEKFHVRPAHGILKYPEKEFVIAYSKDSEDILKKLVTDILEFKTSNYGDYFTSKSFGICTRCKEELKGI